MLDVSDSKIDLSILRLEPELGRQFLTRGPIIFCILSYLLS